MREVESSNQVSLPYNNIGIIQVSKILHEDRGFRSPWKAPSLPRAKKAFLALLMLSETEVWADRFEFHHTPRHFEALEVEMLELPICMRTLAIQYPDPWGKFAIPNKENSPPCPGWGGWGLTLIGA